MANFFPLDNHVQEQRKDPRFPSSWWVVDLRRNLGGTPFVGDNVSLMQKDWTIREIQNEGSTLVLRPA